MSRPQPQESLSYLQTEVDPHVLKECVHLAADLSKNGREGKRVGALFVLGDEEGVLERSHPLILDPLKGHSEDQRSIFHPEMRGTVRELCLLDGAFVISSDGVVVSAARCLDVSSQGIDVPMGLGSRHLAAASVTQATDAIAVVVSQSSAVRMFHDGRIVDELPTDERGSRRVVAPAADSGVRGSEAEQAEPSPVAPPPMSRWSGVPSGLPELPAMAPPRRPVAQKVLT